MKDPVETNRKAFDRDADAYLDRNHMISDSVADQMDRFTDLVPDNGEILDAGCGPGIHAKRFTDEGYRVLGVDISPEMVDRAQGIAPKAIFEVMDLRELEFSEEFDGIWCLATLHFIPRQDSTDVLERLHDALKPGGVLYVSVYSGENAGFLTDDRTGGEKYYEFYTEDRFRKEVEAAGFHVLSFKRSPDTPHLADDWLIIYAEKE